jgi:hypothetical protein
MPSGNPLGKANATIEHVRPRSLSRRLSAAHSAKILLKVEKGRDLVLYGERMSLTGDPGMDGDLERLRSLAVDAISEYIRVLEEARAIPGNKNDAPA